MDRRLFFQTLLSTPVLAPLLLASQSRDDSGEVYLISDTPHTHLPPLINKLLRFRSGGPHSFSFGNPSHQTEKLKLALSRSGWHFTPRLSDANLKISFRALDRPAIPSFTLVKEGRIWDVRSWDLRVLWQELTHNHMPTSLLTVASLARQSSRRSEGETVAIYMNGHRRETVSLEETCQKSYSVPSGRITFEISNRSARIIESSCQHKVCLYSQPISIAGERIICAPNHFLLEVQGPAIDTAIG